MSRKLLAASVAAGAVIVALVMNELERRKIYELGVSDFLARDLRDRRVRIHGTLVPGTLCRLEEPCGYRFALADALTPPSNAHDSAARTLPVSFDGCVVPETFLERPGRDLEVYVSGARCKSCHDFEATGILTRSYDYAPATSPELPPLCESLTPRM